MSNFQIILLAVFGLAIIAGLVLFAALGGGGRQELSEVVLWGSVKADDMAEAVSDLNFKESKTLRLKYVEKDARTLDEELLEALAAGRGPDLAILPSDSILRHRDKLFPIPFASFSERSFKSFFVEGGEVFLGQGVIYALPMFVDPLILYWNRDLLSDAAVASPPATWEEVVTLSPKLSDSDRNGNVAVSAIALGEARNVTNFKEILSALFLQAGTSIVAEESGYLLSVLDRKAERRVPAEEALAFYTSFSNPRRDNYAWNRSLPASRDFFLAGDLALYLGLGSEAELLKASNPNLNFDVAELPLLSPGRRRITFGRVMGAAIIKSSRNLAAASRAAGLLSSADFLGQVSKFSSLAPAARSLLAAPPERVSPDGRVAGAGEASRETVYRAALRARSWLDPAPAESRRLFAEMIEAVGSGEKSVSEAVKRASLEISELVGRYNP